MLTITEYGIAKKTVDEIHRQTVGSAGNTDRPVTSKQLHDELDMRAKQSELTQAERSRYTTGLISDLIELALNIKNVSGYPAIFDPCKDDECRQSRDRDCVARWNSEFLKRAVSLTTKVRGTGVKTEGVEKYLTPSAVQGVADLEKIRYAFQALAILIRDVNANPAGSMYFYKSDNATITDPSPGLIVNQSKNVTVKKSK